MADDRRLAFAAQVALRWAWLPGGWEEHLHGQCELAAEIYGLDPDLVYDKALAETIFGLYKTGVIRRRGPWRNLEAVEFATLEWVDWFNHRRLFGPIGDIPPVEFEALYDGSQEAPAMAVGLT